MSDFSFDYRVRISRRAKHSRIVIEPDASVEVVLPQGVHPSSAPLLLAGKRQWVEQTLQRLGGQVQQSARQLPAQIALPAIGQSFSIISRTAPAKRVSIRHDRSGALIVSGPVDDQHAVVDALHGWLKRQAKQLLPAMLSELADGFGFSYRAVSIRLQKRRWGSCSSQGRISLNARLLFLEPDLVRHVLLHELVHLEIADHSPRFWQRLAQLDPQCDLHRRQLRHVRMPRWTA